MKIIVIDNFHKFTEGELERLSSLGIKDILTWDFWFESEPTRGEYNFDRLIEYEKICHKLGIRLLVMGPVTPPLWIPKEWFLKNKYGMRNDFNNELEPEIEKYLEKIDTSKFTSFTQIPHYTARFLSYWHPEAQAHTKRYIKKIQSVLRYSEHVCCIGHCGEFFFPATSFLSDEKYNGPWWYDEYAEKSWKESKLSREEWFHQESLRITRERLKLYKTKWLQYSTPEHFRFTNLNEFRNIAVEETMEEHKEELNTIIFTVFSVSYFKKVATKQAKKYVVFGGAEGCKNILPNYLRAEKIGLAGLLCQPSLPLNYEPIKEWQYTSLKNAISMNKKGVNRARIIAHSKIPLSYLKRKIKDIERLTGISGIFLKAKYPNLYYKLKDL